MKNQKNGAVKWLAAMLAAACLFTMVGCAKQPEPVETTDATVETTVPETEPHTHEFVDGVCQCGEENGLAGISVETEAGLTEVVVESDEAGISMTSDNAAGEPQRIRLTKEVDAYFGRYYELVYRFTSNVAGVVRFVSEGAAYYETNEFEVKTGENEIVVRFAAGKDAGGKIGATLELGALDKFELNFSAIECEELTSDLNPYFLDVADQATGNMVKNGDGHLVATFRANEGWRVKLAVDRNLVKGTTYETTFVFTKEGGRAQNVTFTVYDGAATMVGSKTKWVDNDVCVATFYFTANENIKKGTCLELGQLCDGGDVKLTFTYVDFAEVSQEKLGELLEQNPFPGVNAWTEGALLPAEASQSADGLKLINPNAATDWWKVKLEKALQIKNGSYYRIKFNFNSNAAGRIKFVNDDATYYGSNEYDVKVGENTFTVEIKSGGNSYSCLELGGLGKCELLFTEISVEEIEAPEGSQQPAAQNKPGRFSNFRVWTDASVGPITRGDTETLMALLSYLEPTDWWKVKVETDINGKAGQCYEATFTFTSNVAGRIKFVNDAAVYYGSNEYDVVEGENVFTVRFKHNGNPYTCLELGGLGKFHLVFKDYTLKKIEEPEVTTNGFENYKAWTEASMKPVTREDGENSLTLISENDAADWWKVKLETNFPLEAGKTYEATFKFNSNATGDIKFGTNEKVICHSSDVYAVAEGENTFAVTFTAADGAYTCLELGGLGAFELTFTEITLKETEKPEQDPEHVHSFVNGLCQCGENNGFAGVSVWTEGSLIPAVREDTATSMTMTSENAAGDWWKVKLEYPLSVAEGKSYEVTFKFGSNAAGTIKYVVDAAIFLGANEYNVKVGENSFTVQFTAGAQNYSCLELGGLGAFELTFTEISLKAVQQPADPEEPTDPEQPTEHEHSFANGVCQCGETNGFEGFKVWNEGSLTPVVREDTATTMKLISANAAGDWWKVKVENGFATEAGKTYKATYTFTSNAEGDIKFGGDNMTCHSADVYHVVVGENTFTVTFTVSASNAYNCLEMGGLGAFEVTFTGISLEEAAAPTPPPAHEHSFVNGVCQCGETNGFEGFKVWNEGSLTPVVREDTATTMKLISANAAGDWWKVKVENGFATEAGKTYKATYTFTSNAEGDIKFGGDNMTCHSADVYHVVVGENTFTVTFTVSASNAYNCLEMGGLGAFEVTFTGISLEEAAAPTPPPAHEHSFVNGVCQCGETNGFEGFKVWNEGSLTPVVREDTATTMKLISANAAGDWWKVKVENGFATEAGKTYKATYTFTSNAEGDIKFGGDNMTCHSADVYHVVVGENTFTVTFTVSASNAYNCLEMGGLGAFEVTFTGISLEEAAAPTPPPAHEHSFVNGVCQCGETNGFEGFKVWNEGSLTPVVREDTATTMKLISANAAGDWWKVKVENGFATEAGKTYKATYTFTSNAEGDIKFGGDNMTCHSADVYHVVVGENTFTVTFTVSASNAYNCLEMGGLGTFEVTFTGISLEEV